MRAVLPGATFADALRAVRRLPVAEFIAYGLSDADATLLVERFMRWAQSINPC